MSDQFLKRKQLLGALYGLIAGVAFAFTAWGIDGIALSRAHASYPFIKFLPGLILCALLGTLFGWMSIRIGKGLVTIAIWLIFAFVLVWSIIWLPFKLTPTLLRVLQPSLADWIDFPMIANVDQFRIVGMMAIALPTIICGLLESNIVEMVLMSSHKGALLTIILVCGLLMSLAGSAGDEIIAKILREPVQVLDNLFQFAIDHQGKEIDIKLARRMHYSTVRDLEEILPRSRRLTLIAFDENLAQMNILVNFDGIWVKCTTIYSQPTMCEHVLQAPVYYISQSISSY